MANKKKKTFNWFNSSMWVLVLIFLISLPIAIIRLGMDAVIDHLIVWTLGSVFVALILIIAKKLWR